MPLDFFFLLNPGWYFGRPTCSHYSSIMRIVLCSLLAVVALLGHTVAAHQGHARGHFNRRSNLEKGTTTYTTFYGEPTS